jgi:hypothetical protein
MDAPGAKAIRSISSRYIGSPDQETVAPRSGQQLLDAGAQRR